MEYIVPIAVTLYIVFSVVSAVLKAMSSQPPQKGAPQSPQPIPPGRLGQEVMESPIPITIFDEADRTEPKASIDEDLYRSNMDEDLEDLASSHSSPRDASQSVPGPVQQRSKDTMHLGLREMRAAVIMSEVLREPRAKRQWPAR